VPLPSCWLSVPPPGPSMSVAAERAAGRARAGQDLRPGACRQRRARRAAEHGQRASGHARVSDCGACSSPLDSTGPGLTTWCTCRLCLCLDRLGRYMPPEVAGDGDGQDRDSERYSPFAWDVFSMAMVRPVDRLARTCACFWQGPGGADGAWLVGPGSAGSVLHVDRAPPPGRVHAALHHHQGDRQGHQVRRPSSFTPAHLSGPWGPAKRPGVTRHARKRWCKEIGTDRAALPPPKQACPPAVHVGPAQGPHPKHVRLSLFPGSEVVSACLLRPLHGVA
jgi:hypothetical protein